MRLDPNQYEFEWDQEKARSNELKHGVSFGEARTVFLDVFAVEVIDGAHSIGEDRFILLGSSERGRVLVGAFAFRDHMIRIISAREAHRQERLEYEKQISS